MDSGPLQTGKGPVRSRFDLSPARRQAGRLLGSDTVGRVPGPSSPDIGDDRDVRAATADLLNGLLGLIEAGEIDASSAHAKRMVRQIEGAVAALRATCGT